MGVDFDCFKSPYEYQKWCATWGKELSRILKPGAHMLVFSGTRTSHRLTCGIEDAGFEPRDMINWIYGSGMVKALNIGKAFDKKLGVESTIVKPEDLPPALKRNLQSKDDFSGGRLHANITEKRKHVQLQYKVPASDLGKKWEGWYSGIKPAHEPIILFRNPISENTIIENITEHNTGGLNIDDCRVTVNSDVDDMSREVARKERESPAWKYGSGFKNEKNYRTGVLPEGRFPANVILSHHQGCEKIQNGEQIVKQKERDRLLKTGENPSGKYGIYNDGMRSPVENSFETIEPELWKCVEGCPVAEMNMQSGKTARGHYPKGHLYGYGKNIGTGGYRDYAKGIYTKDEGGAARYFNNFKGPSFYYIPKTSVKERELGCESLVGKPSKIFNNRKRIRGNTHITVKPLSLMKHLVTLITPENGIVIDPFAGSGSTLIAAKQLGFDFVGIELEEEFIEIAELRLEAYPSEETTVSTQQKFKIEKFKTENDIIQKQLEDFVD